MTKLSSKFYRRWLFALGIIATISYRAIIVLNYYSPLLVQIAWYIGTVGFIWYFSHRFNIESRRDRLISQLKLIEKIQERHALSEEDRESLIYILNSLQTSLAKWNYIAIFVFSAIALVYGIYQDIVHFFLQ